VAGESVNTVVETQAAEAVLDGSAIASDSVAVSDSAVVGDGPDDTVSVSDGPGAGDVATADQDAADALDAPEGTDAYDTDAYDTDAYDTGEPDHDPETDDSGAINLKADGEPPDVSERRMNVTETLTADALMPEIAFAPEARVPEVALQARAAWDAADAVTEIYRSHYSQLVRLSVLLVHDVQTAEEVVQEAFEAMHQAWKRLRDSEKALQYLRQTVVNKSRSVLRHRKVVDLHAPKPAPDEPSAEQAALAILERSAVAAALRSLSGRQRGATALRC
jgi:DNA-directed RNA polymerase specialized sigma24 family protein